MTMRAMKTIFHVLLFLGFSLAHAGSYDDFFKAIELDDEVAVGKLLQRGFDANTVNPAGVPGLLLAIKSPSPKVVRALLNWPKTRVEQRNPTDESALMLAALTGDLELCQLLISKDADVNKTGWTPLHYAATNGQLAVIRLLLDEHAYIDAESPNRTTPLMMAAMYGTAAAVKVLLEAGADPLLKNMQGLNALDFAERVSRAESAEIIRAFVRGRQPKGAW